MGKKTYEEYLVEKNPGVEAIAQHYAELGVARPLLYAEAELEGKAPYAGALFGYALRNEINPPDDHRWIAAARDGTLNFENETLREQAAGAVRYLEQHGIDMTRLTPLIRAIQTQTVVQVTTILDHGPHVLGLSIPEEREVYWGLFSVNGDDTVGGQIGVRDVVNDPDEL